MTSPTFNEKAREIARARYYEPEQPNAIFEANEKSQKDFLSGARWSREETIREVLEMLSGERCGRDMLLGEFVVLPMELEKLRDWLEARLKEK